MECWQVTVTICQRIIIILHTILVSTRNFVTERLRNDIFALLPSQAAQTLNTINTWPEEVGHGPKGIMVGRISESQTLFYRGHEINMASF